MWAGQKRLGQVGVRLLVQTETSAVVWMCICGCVATCACVRMYVSVYASTYMRMYILRMCICIMFMVLCVHDIVCNGSRSIHI